MTILMTIQRMYLLIFHWIPQHRGTIVQLALRFRYAVLADGDSGLRRQSPTCTVVLAHTLGFLHERECLHP